MRNDEPDRILIEYIYIRLVTVIPISSNFSATASTVPNSVLFMNTLEAGLCWIDWRARWATSHLSVRVFLSFSSAAGQLQAVDVDRARARERRQWQRARVSSQVKAHSQRREEVRKNICIRRMVFFFKSCYVVPTYCWTPLEMRNWPISACQRRWTRRRRRPFRKEKRTRRRRRRYRERERTWHKKCFAGLFPSKSTRLHSEL